MTICFMLVSLRTISSDAHIMLKITLIKWRIKEMLLLQSLITSIYVTLVSFLIGQNLNISIWIGHIFIYFILIILNITLILQVNIRVNSCNIGYCPKCYPVMRFYFNTVLILIFIHLYIHISIIYENIILNYLNSSTILKYNIILIWWRINYHFNLYI